MSRGADLAQRLVKQLGLRGAGEREAAENLCAWLSPEVTVRPTAAGFGFTLHHPPGATVWAPPGDTRTLAHEACHATEHVGFGRHLMMEGGPCARQTLWKEERLADDFADGFMGWVEE